MLWILPLLMGFSPSQVESNAPVESVRSEHLRIPSTRVSLIPRPGFVLSASFVGLQHPDTSAAIHVSELEAGYEEIANAWNDSDSLEARGMTVLSVEPAPQGSNPGKLFKFAQTVGELKVRKWVWMFGNESMVVMVVGTCPVGLSDEFFNEMRSMVLTATWDPNLEIDALAAAPFVLRYTGEFDAWFEGGNFFLTLDGKVDESGKKPLFVCSPSIRPEIGDPLEISQARLLGTRDHRLFNSLRTERILIDGLSGYEILASAEDTESGVAKSIYQVMLFEGASYWLMQGIVASDQSEKFIPEFERMAKGFRRKQETLTTKSGRASLTVPAMWSIRTGIVDDSDLQAGHPVADCWLILNSAAKDEANAESSFEEFGERVRAVFEESGAHQHEPIEMTIDGKRAVITEHALTEDGMKFTYMLATIDGKHANHQILLWTSTKTHSRSRDEFFRILVTFRELD